MSGRRRGPAAWATRLALGLAAAPYSAVLGIRRAAYRRGILPARRAEKPVISVGNLTAGGTGKTPMVAWVVGRLIEMQRRPGVLTRGYKAAGGVSDEASLLTQLCGPEVPVVVQADRTAGAAQAVAQGADVLVMDDGFQHRRLHRDLDIVLIDATNPLGFGHVLPRGLLREPTSALADADAVVITRSDAVEPGLLQSLSGRLASLAPRASLHHAVHRPLCVIDEHGRRQDLKAIAGRKVAAFCGIGNPEQFFDTLGRLHARVACKRSFDDHMPYDQSMIDSLSRQTCICDAELLVTTTKDHVRLGSLRFDRPVWQVVVEMDVTVGREQLLERLRETVQGR